LLSSANCWSNLLQPAQTCSDLLEPALSTIIRINNVTKSLKTTLVIHLSFVKNKVTKNMILMEIDKENNDPISFRLYIKFSQARYLTNGVF